MRRLGIIDLMLVTTVVVCNFALFQVDAPASRTSAWIFYPLFFTRQLTLGLVLPAIYWLPLNYLQTGKMFSQPGHWILGAFFLVLIWNLGFYIALVSLGKFSLDEQTFFIAANFIRPAFLLGAAALSIVAAFETRVVRWKIALIFLTLYFVAQELQSVFYSIMPYYLSLLSYEWGVGIAYNVCVVLATIFIIAAILLDWKSRIARDWLHRVGWVSTLTYMSVFPLLKIVLMRFIALESR